jgi:predicted metal-dependent hydrolase
VSLYQYRDTSLPRTATPSEKCQALVQDKDGDALLVCTHITKTLNDHANNTLGDILCDIRSEFARLCECNIFLLERHYHISDDIDKAKTAVEDFRKENGWMLDEAMDLVTRALSIETECMMTSRVEKARGRVRAMETCLEGLDEWASFLREMDGATDEKLELYSVEVVAKREKGEEGDHNLRYILDKERFDLICHACGRCKLD